ncbi:DUF5696 domain-containing protein [Paenibacillus harenae]|uniref:Solute-binding protein family 5 domain-containing protein n=1 Tax=Paenibacillus harenae TaxID=306543 RepID=A0ABT9TZH2_PAEHA|nr:DUF5696 domain-containing protein [Paenibacillus harenae]MDQ0112759.1 hypothetical protein [Paenibacillus harenae]
MTKHRIRSLAVLFLTSLLILSAACTSATAGTEEPVGASVMENGNPDETLKALGATANVEPQIQGLEPVLENSALRLYISRTTAEIAVLDHGSGQIWRSNPDSSGDKLASPYLKGKLSSQLSFVYLTKNGQNKDYDSYNNSVKFNQFEIIQSESGVSVVYRFGDPDKGLESIPLQVSKERFEERLLARLEDPADQEQLKIRYKFNEETEIYERRDIPKAVVKRLLALFEKMEYTEEDLGIDNSGGGGDSETEEAANPKFTVTLHYTLDGNQLIASVDAGTIQEETQPYRIHTISLLENFGAAGTGDDGYLFLPDGSGTLVRFNSGKSLAQPILIPIYGDDSTIYAREKFNTLEPSRLPVFGMKKNDAAFLAIIEDGEALAKLSADISGRLHEFNTVAPQFTILPKDEVRLSANEIMHKTPAQSYRGKLKIRYSFLSGEQAGYAGMAASYRSYLEEAYGMRKLKPEGDAPFYLELTGTIPKRKNRLGFPYEAIVPLTDLGQAETIVQRLNAEQIGNVRLSYKGWFNEGLNHERASSIDMDGVIGSKSEWKQLTEKLQASGGGFYPDTALLRVYRDSGGFSPSKDAAQYISRRYAKLYEFDRAAFFRSDRFSHYLLSPTKLEATVDGFLSDYGKLNPGSVSLRDLGSELYSDFRRSGEVTREDAKRKVTAAFEQIHEQSPDIMVNGGNAYALPFASHILNLPQKSNEYQLAGESVPFIQMALHGYVEYAGKAYNTADDQDVRENMLRSLETGSNVYFSWFYEEPSVLKDTRFSYLYSNHYEQWLDEAVQAYAEVAAVLNKVRGQSMTDHEKLAEQVYKTEYGNGVSVIVNYSDEPYEYEGTMIEANHYGVRGDTNG